MEKTQIVKAHSKNLHGGLQFLKGGSDRFYSKGQNLSRGLKEMKEHYSASTLKQEHITCLKTSQERSVAEAE